MSPNAPKEKDREDIVRSQTEAKEMWALEGRGIPDQYKGYILVRIKAWRLRSMHSRSCVHSLYIRPFDRRRSSTYS